MEVVRLYIAVASCRDWKPQFGSSMVGLMFNLGNKGVKGHALMGLKPQFGLQASCLSQAREKALIDATNQGFTHILCLDDDMIFPGDIVDRLIAHNKDFVAANYRRKCSKKIGVSVGFDGEPLSSEAKTGLEKVAITGGGCFLAKLDAMKKIPAPRFEVVWSPENQDYFDQDGVFGFKLREHNIDIYIDHDASQLVEHVGDAQYAWPKQEDLMKEAA